MGRAPAGGSGCDVGAWRSCGSFRSQLDEASPDSQRAGPAPMRLAGVWGCDSPAANGVVVRTAGRRRFRGQSSRMPTSVLIVDDHPSFRASARRMLEASGYRGRRRGRRRGQARSPPWASSVPTWSCSTCSCPTSTASRSRRGCGRSARRRRSSSPRAATAPTSARGGREPRPRLHRQGRAERPGPRGADRMSESAPSTGRRSAFSPSCPASAPRRWS